MPAARHNTFPGEVFLRVAADALAWCPAVAYVRAAADWAGVPVRQECEELTDSPGAPAG